MAVWGVWYSIVGAIAYYLAGEGVVRPSRRLGVAISWPLWAAASYVTAVYCAAVLLWREVRGRS